MQSKQEIEFVVNQKFFDENLSLTITRPLISGINKRFDKLKCCS